MKKLLLAILLLILPWSVADAYRNEPMGFGHLWWNISVSDMSEQYFPIPQGEGENGSSVYLVRVPDANGELGLKGAQYLLCYFQNDELKNIEIFLLQPKSPEEQDMVYKNTVYDLTQLFGKPVNEEGATAWYGTSTVIFTMKLDDNQIVIDLADTDYFEDTLKGDYWSFYR